MNKLFFIEVFSLSIFLYSCSPLKSGQVNSKEPTQPHNQELLTLIENDPDKNTIALNANHKVVDPNSTITININKDVLKEKLSSSFLSTDITNRLINLKAMISHEEQSMREISEAIRIYNTRSTNPDFREILRKQKEFVNLILLDKESLAIYKSLLPSTSSTLDQYKCLFKTASQMIQVLQDKINEEAKKNGVYLQLGAWLENKNQRIPIHIPDYDEYNSQPSSRVEQFQYVLTPQQSDELKNIGQLAQDAKKNGLGTTFINEFKNINYFTQFQNLSSYKSARDIKNQLEIILRSTDDQLSTLKNPTQNCYQAIKDYDDFINAIIQTYKNISTSNVDQQKILIDVNNDLVNIVSKTADLKATLTNYTNLIISNADAAVNDITRNIRTIAATLNTINGNIESDLNIIKQRASDFFSLVSNVNGLSQQAYTFTDKVKKVDFGQQLKEATIDLQKAGKRDEGDVLTILLSTATPSTPIVEQAFVHYSLYFCSLYAKTSTAFLFVNPAPLFERVNEKALFHYSASYSILFKGFWKNSEKSRTNLSYHTKFSPGIGLNFATLNFNTNGATELGIGGVFTTFNEWFQLGYGFNTFSGTPYFFFGFNIPIGSFSLTK